MIRLLKSDLVLRTELLEQIEEFERRLKNLDDAQWSVENEVELRELESDIESVAQFRDDNVRIFVEAKQKLTSFSKEIDSENPSAILKVDNKQKPATRLPKLELPKFSGDYAEWQTFWDKYRAVINESETVPVVNKFTYLQSLLQGEADSAVSGLSLTAENYETAKDILVKRLGRPERIIFSHIQKFLQSNVSLSSRDSFTPIHLWKLHDEIVTRVRSLQNLGVGGETYGVFLTPLILHQLPSNIRLEWARVGEGHEGDLDFLLKFLYNKIQRRERSQTFGNGSGTPSSTAASGSGQNLQPEKTFRQERRRPGTAAALLAGGRQTRPTCVFCRGAHFSDTCREIKSISFEDRKDKIKKQGLCLKCLGTHMARDCQKTCYFCKGTHHSVLCKKQMR